ncbi:MAG: MarR family transcriptional regulator [Citromicrobium sp.]|nr:MAG: MarR family transcriptional regulator [Citromicrobium sp.]
MSGKIEPLFQPPARLQIMAALAACDEAEFATMRDVIEVSDSVLSKHLSALSDAGYIRIKKAKLDGRQRTWASITSRGNKALSAHLAALRSMMESARAAVAAE